ncbi:EpsI [Sulfuricaulis limicola]|uniref:EpsI n=1 Tax=Sulfuricaulis limicola TaxID=1620215 RepID=A0A1B4XGG7_9GAMM|nr:VPLPA-CTERM-specific exosortase XrtD [Sulfuricaulis limicola]BAV33902.1 EpsI [Sulfuricaulis limicola]
MTDSASPVTVWKMTPLAILFAVIVSGLLGLTFHKGFDFIFYMWFNKEEYSHGVLIPFISAFLIWQRKDVLERLPFTGSVTGVVLVVLGLVLFVMGRMSALSLLINYAMIIVIAGLFLAYMGWRALQIILVPVLLLFFMIPLPGFLYETFSANMQLLSSEIGVAIIRMFGISVFLEGNVIDLGSMKLQVVEACSGLRYMFPLVTLGLIAAYFYKDSLWKRITVVLSSIPIAILMNSVRIGVIGVLVEYGGPAQAEGFLHDFEGWIVFMACTAVLVGEIWLLSKVGGVKRPLRQVFGLEFPSDTPKEAMVQKRTLPIPFIVASVIIAATAIASIALPERTSAAVPRKPLSEFPLHLGDWQGRAAQMEKMYIDVLNFDDYLLANYVGAKQQVPVNLYVAYYENQLAAHKVPHSPRACLPGGGWKLTDLRVYASGATSASGEPLMVNRVVIQHGDQKQLVYYWFQQRGRNITSEYLVKWYIFWDSLMKNRTDGALVRLVSPIMPNEDIADADRRLAEFTRQISEPLRAYIPD